MDNRTLALVASFIAMLCVIFAYFTTKKERFLFFQSICIVFLIVSYFFTVQFFAMVGLFIGLLRALIYFAYERKERVAPISIPIGLCLLTGVSYVIVNWMILDSVTAADIILLVSLMCYIFIFRVRNLKLVRFLMVIPTVLSIIFNVWTHAALFATLSYAFELGANVTSIFRYHVFGGFFDKSKKAPR